MKETMGQCEDQGLQVYYMGHETSVGFGRDWGRVEHCARTTTRIRRHANEENKKQDPKPRRQMKLFNVGVLIWVFLCVCEGVCVYSICISLSVRVCVCVCVCVSVVESLRPCAHAHTCARVCV